MQTWKTLKRRPILKYSKYLTVEEHDVELPDGQRIKDWPWLVTPDFINVVIVDEQGLFVLFRQVKYAVEGTSLAPVGGYIEPGEDPLLAAKREVLEETGYEAPNWVSLGQYAVDGNRGAGTAYAYLATGAKQVAQPDADDLEEQEFLLMSRDDVRTALLTGEFKVIPWSNVLALALLQLQTTENRT
ncbi:NUDIX hydrolase [Phototrophicus methaneseepsis]|uniref:NUDIX hydrolase n=1 Tax=Phototrophicus methaneseepsis TaxID=2710758 RepID=A0A7S8IEH8_9CHLR|nr:NUDIX hydrolase [Phototrophicus methaneseepsis]QPC81838.1 NUDIX hydrolase [Phototrophicus methaneseepsis]